MKVKKMKEQLEQLDDEHEIILEAPNAPPWLTEFRFRVVDPAEADDSE